MFHGLILMLTVRILLFKVRGEDKPRRSVRRIEEAESSRFDLAAAQALKEEKSMHRGSVTWTDSKGFRLELLRSIWPYFNLVNDGHSESVNDTNDP